VITNEGNDAGEDEPDSFNLGVRAAPGHYSYTAGNHENNYAGQYGTLVVTAQSRRGSTVRAPRRARRRELSRQADDRSRGYDRPRQWRASATSTWRTSPTRS
jgi:hypothetical protein